MRILSLLLLGALAAAAGAPPSLQADLDLALSLCRSARDTGSSATYRQADEAITRALQASPGNYDALKLRILVLLGLHDFSGALTRARELNHKSPDDVSVWGYLAEANVGIGEYAEAIRDAQWILDLRRGSTLGFTIAARMREISGDLEGARSYYDEALLRVPQEDVQERAWLMTEEAHLQMTMGNKKQARDLLQAALKLSPDNQSALGSLAELETLEGKYDDAILLCRQRLKTADSAEAMYRLAVMLGRAGRMEDADTAYRNFEVKAKAEMGGTLNANRELVFYYADHKNLAAQALAIAAKDAEARHDSETLDAFAWALYCSGKLPEAQAQIERALAPGVREASYFCHALQIAKAREDAVGVKKWQGQLATLPVEDCAK